MGLTDEGCTSPKFSFCHDSGRPIIRKYSAEPKFRPNDEVTIQSTGTTTRDGPYIISSIENGRYKLCDVNGNAIKNGMAFEEKDLELQDPFE